MFGFYFVEKQSRFYFVFDTDVRSSTPGNIQNVYHYSEKAFIFSIINNEGLPPFKSTLKADWARHWATMSSPFSGPLFGGAYDLQLLPGYEEGGTSVAALGCYYSLPNGVRDHETLLAGTRKFVADEIVVLYFV